MLVKGNHSIVKAPHYQYTAQPKQQYLEEPYTKEPDQQYSEQSYACGHYQQHLGREDYSERCSKGPADGSYIDGDLAFIKDVVSNYHSDLSKNCNNASVGHVFERKLPSDPDPESSDTTLQEAHPYIVQPDQQEPDFDMANCSATDIDCWASSLLAKQFVYLRLMGSLAQNESFKQYAISHIDRPTPSLTRDNCEHSHQRSE
ncbi:hypothetical protein MJO29_015965 [Puccinia striiformis f. sp. tritici]|nr:hypothetical protein MJO29_015965 [Puccinia striiformis f. sp. tritici]